MRLIGVCALLSLVACSDDPLSSVENGLVIFSSAPVANAGDTVSIRVINWSAGTLQGNLCPIALQTRQGATWVTVYSEPGPGSACPDYLRRFRSGQATERPLVLPAVLPLGEYRVAFLSLAVDDGPSLPEDLRASRPFQVRH